MITNEFIKIENTILNKREIICIRVVDINNIIIVTDNDTFLEKFETGIEAINKLESIYKELNFEPYSPIQD